MCVCVCEQELLLLSTLLLEFNVCAALWGSWWKIRTAHRIYLFYPTNIMLFWREFLIFSLHFIYSAETRKCLFLFLYKLIQTEMETFTFTFCFSTFGAYLVWACEFFKIDGRTNERTNEWNEWSERVNRLCITCV